MEREIFTQINIAAPAPRVWQVLTEWEAYPQWNPFIRHVEGCLAEGERLRLRVHLPHGRTVGFKPRIQRLQAGRELVWLGHLWLPGLLDGEHSLQVEAVDDTRSVFIQRERFTGLLAPLLWPSLKRRTRRGFMLMNAALKGRIEQYGLDNPG